MFGRNAWARVRNLDAHLSRLAAMFALAGDDDLECPALAHGFKAVQAEIHKDLLQLVVIAHDRRHRRLIVADNRDVAPREFAGNQGKRLLNRSDDADRMQWHRRATGQAAQATHQAVDAVDLIERHFREGLAELLIIILLWQEFR
jgi:hypothetical protein